jgi:hypothetical protein
MQRSQLFTNPVELAALARSDLEKLRAGGMKPSAGDIRCIVYGHLTRMGVWNLRGTWDAGLPVRERLARFAQGIADMGDAQAVIEALKTIGNEVAAGVAEPRAAYVGAEEADAVPF